MGGASCGCSRRLESDFWPKHQKSKEEVKEEEEQIRALTLWPRKFFAQDNVVRHDGACAGYNKKCVDYYSTSWGLLVGVDVSCGFRVLVLFNAERGIVEPYHHIEILVGIC